MIKVGLIGYGYWGPNIARNFNAHEEAEIVKISDIDPDALARAKKAFPNIETTTNYKDITESPEIDVVAIITPVFFHFEPAKNALENGKHVFVEKPFTSTVQEAEELIELASKKNLQIMVDHTFLFTGGVKKIKELIDNNTLGDLYYYDSTRVNLGLFQHDINVIWDLAPHDLSIMNYIIKDKPSAITANGVDHFGRGLEDVAYVTVYFDNNLIAHFNVNWLSPVKIRNTLIGGTTKMLVWNDLEPDEKIKIYDKGVDIKNKEGVYNLLVEYRSGDVWTPMVKNIEALKVETNYFIECLKDNEIPFNDGVAGLEVVKILEATNESIKNNGKMVKL
ncbi:MAG: Gfo/Idh/MocA family oxidoreductase [bacterium]|nr:Gfo/Idh/MocA family oxidoreductase [bacterium]